ncbi:hypothetical protein CLJ1_1712 [Pseudomonas paraeruginosa]|nr:hypothetical protein CLJ1_1712 [Pseudomonas aeruginosa]
MQVFPPCGRTPAWPAAEADILWIRWRRINRGRPETLFAEA